VYQVEGVDDDGQTNNTVIITWTESGASATLNGKTYTSGTAIRADGDYVFEITDEAGNVSTYNFVITHSKPNGQLYTVTNSGEMNIATNGTYTNQKVCYVWEDKKYTATLNGLPYNNGDFITDENEYTLIITDLAGNVETITFTIDKTAPEGTLTGVVNGGYTNKNVTLSWSDKYSTATVNGLTYTSGNLIKEEGVYTVELTDRAGNTSYYSFTIDKTEIEYEINGVELDGVTNGAVIVTWEEKNISVNCNNQGYTSGKEITEEGAYTITLTDRAGNITTITFTIDKTAPEGTLTGVENGGYTNTITSFSWKETSATATLNGETYTSGTLIGNESYYIIELTDKAGNTSTYSFTIDKTAPEGTLTGVENGGETNNIVTFYWTEEGATATLNGEAYESGTEVVEEGLYNIILTDKAGNSSIATFTIDITPPTIDGIENGQKFNSNVRLTTESNNVNILVKFTSFNSSDETSYSVKNNELLSSSGNYTIILTDRAGNVNSYSFSINKERPTIQVVAVDTDTTLIESVSNKNTYTVRTAFRLDAKDDISITVNDEIYRGNHIEEVGVYTVICTDSYGNTTSFNIEIAEQLKATTQSAGNSVAITIILCVLGGLAIAGVVTKIIISRMKRTHNLHR
jgi:hypothetical protein